MKGKITKRTVDAITPESSDVFLWDVETKGFGYKVTPEGRRVYILQYRMGGRGFPTRRYTLGKHGEYTPEQARSEAENLLQGIRKGHDPMATKRAAKENTIGSLIADFIVSRRKKGRKSVDEVDRLLEREVAAVWRQRPVPSVTAADVTRLVEGIRDRGSPATGNQTLTHLKTLFNWAVNRGAILASPAAGVEMPAPQISRDRTHSDRELVEVWEAAGAIGGLFGPAVQLLVLTGQRREEVAQMAWSELNLKAKVWTIPGNRTKNGQPHDVHLSDKAVRLINKLPRLEKVDLVFTRTGATPISGWSKAKTALDTEIQRKRQELGQESMPAWRIHDLRRTFATGLNDLRVLPHVADRILNHVSKKKGGVMAVYNRALYAGERKAAMTLWSDHLDQLFNAKAAKVLQRARGKKGSV